MADSSRDSDTASRQWRVSELTCTADTDFSDPFDLDQVQFSALFEGPAGQRLLIPGFWDGEKTWKIRFTPTTPGLWKYTTRLERGQDAGLAGRTGTLHVLAAASGDHPLRAHGGFLKVSDNKRYLTCSDGTPFFWLGDTWWSAPSENVPLENFRNMVDLRVAQGYTVFQAHGHRPIIAADKVGALEAIRGRSPQVLRYWRQTDRYIQCAEEKGIVGAIGFAAHSLLDSISLEDLKRLWRYYVARYGAYPIVFLITQEYNADIGNLEQRLPKMLGIGQYIHELDPYQRAMTVHPWARSRDNRAAWKEPWLDFVMQQGGHNHIEKPKVYHDIYFGPVARPIVEGEANYEGFQNKTFTTDAAAMRQAAYTAIQAGCCGYTYGAQGLYAGVLRKEAPLTTFKWGPVLTWEEGLNLPGGAQMKHLRAFYEALPWWKLEPRPALVKPESSLLVKSDGDALFVLYYPPVSKDAPELKLSGASSDARYAGHWFNPRTGEQMPLEQILQASGDLLVLPPRPDRSDWLLVLKR